MSLSHSSGSEIPKPPAFPHQPEFHMCPRTRSFRGHILCAYLRLGGFVSTNPPRSAPLIAIEPSRRLVLHHPPAPTRQPRRRRPAYSRARARARASSALLAAESVTGDSAPGAGQTAPRTGAICVAVGARGARASVT